MTQPVSKVPNPVPAPAVSRSSSRWPTGKGDTSHILLSVGLAGAGGSGDLLKHTAHGGSPRLQAERMAARRRFFRGDSFLCASWREPQTIGRRAGRGSSWVWGVRTGFGGSLRVLPPSLYATGGQASGSLFESTGWESKWRPPHRRSA